MVILCCLRYLRATDIRLDAFVLKFALFSNSSMALVISVLICPRKLQKRALVVSPDRQKWVFKFTSRSVARIVCVLIHRSGMPERKQKAFLLRVFIVLIGRVDRECG